MRLYASCVGIHPAHIRYALRPFQQDHGRSLSEHMMNLHEYQAKRLLTDYGIPVPRGVVRAPRSKRRAPRANSAARAGC